MSRREEDLPGEDAYRALGNLKSEAERHPRLEVERVEHMRNRMDAYEAASDDERRRILEDVEAELATIESKLESEAREAGESVGDLASEAAQETEAELEDRLAETERRASSFVGDLRDRIDRLRGSG